MKLKTKNRHQWMFIYMTIKHSIIVILVNLVNRSLIHLVIKWIKIKFKNKISKLFLEVTFVLKYYFNVQYKTS